jgi:hypothetical protein
VVTQVIRDVQMNQIQSKSPVCGGKLGQNYDDEQLVAPLPLVSHSERRSNKLEDDVEVDEIDEVPDAHKQKANRLLCQKVSSIKVKIN